LAAGNRACLYILPYRIQKVLPDKYNILRFIRHFRDELLLHVLCNSEAIYFFTEPRGKRSDYHMLRSQWHLVFREGLGNDFSCLCDSICYADENMALFTMIYTKDI